MTGNNLSLMQITFIMLQIIIPKEFRLFVEDSGIMKYANLTIFTSADKAHDYI